MQTVVISTAIVGAACVSSALLTALICVSCLLANILISQQITLFGLEATATDAFAIGAAFGLNILQEWYGKSIARTAISYNIALLMFYVVITQLHLLYVAASHDVMYMHYHAIMGTAPRIIGSSLVVYYISQYVDYLLYGYFKRLLSNHALIPANIFSLIISQALDTVLFTYIGLWGIVHNPTDIIIVSYTIKLMIIACTSPFMLMAHYCMVYKNNWYQDKNLQ